MTKAKRSSKRFYLLRVSSDGIVHGKEGKRWVTDFIVMDKMMQEVVWHNHGYFDRIFAVSSGEFK